MIEIVWEPFAYWAILLGLGIPAALASWPNHRKTSVWAWVGIAAATYVLFFLQRPGPISVVLGFMVLAWVLRALDVAQWGQGLSRFAYAQQVLDPLRPGAPDETPPPPRRTILLRALRAPVLMGCGAGLELLGWHFEPWEVHPYLADLLFAVELAVLLTAFADLGAAIAWTRGIPTPDPHDPLFLLSPSLRRFWGNAWNRFTSDVLRRGIFQPVGGRKAMVRGVLLVFLASGLLHGLPQLLMEGGRRTAVWFAFASVLFFVIHGVAVIVEAKLRRRLRGWRGHVYVWVVLLVTVPLYPAPLGMALGAHGRPLESATFAALAPRAGTNRSGETMPTEPRAPVPFEVLEVLELDPPRTVGPVSLEEALSKRRSKREFTGQPLTPKELSQLLWAAQGRTSEWGGRTAPSAGALYPVEVFAVTPTGLLHYVSANHTVEVLLREDLRPALARAALGQECVAQAAAVLVIAAVRQRTAVKYGSRAERYVILEAGHAAQNVLLETTALGLGAVPVGAFEDAALQRLLRLGLDTEPLYLIAVGHPAEGGGN